MRFADPREVQDAVFHALSEALRTAPWLRHDREPQVGGASLDGGAGMGELPVSTAGEEVAAMLERARSRGAGPVDLDLAPAPREPDEEQGGFFFSANPGPAAGYFASLRYIGQHHRTYLLCEAPGGALVVIDQHASHERLLFHRFRQAFAARKLLVQPFLIPQVVQLAVGPARVLEASLSELRVLGFDLEPFGGESFAVKGAPAALGGVDLRALLTDLSGEIELAHRSSSAEEIHGHLLATMACHAAVRANEEITAEEVRALLDALDGIEFKARCPHGRPVVFELALSDLERRVGRR